MADPRPRRVYIDAKGRPLPDPYRVLGITPQERDPEVIREAWRAGMLEHPPQHNPGRARGLTQARDRLLDPDRVLERELGCLEIPTPDAWHLPDLRGETRRDHLTAESRLLGQAVLYALLEDALWTSGFEDDVQHALQELSASGIDGT